MQEKGYYCLGNNEVTLLTGNVQCMGQTFGRCPPMQTTLRDIKIATAAF